MSVVRSLYRIRIGGQNVSSVFLPLLIDLTVTDKVGTHSDTASLTLDDSGGRIIVPRIGDPVVIWLGSTGGGGFDEVFRGVIDEPCADGSRSSGRTVKIGAKGLDTTGKAKEPQQRHFDDATVQQILDAAGSHAGITVECRDGLGSLPRKYLEMRDESFIHLGERMARELGANFRVTGSTATLTKRAVGFEGLVSAVWGVNLHSYSIKPKIGRPQFSETRARWYDKDEAAWKEKLKSTGATDADARYTARYILPDEDEADQRSDSDKATTERDKGDGTVAIELNPSAKPDGLCLLAVGKAGIDGSYRIETVTHRLSRGSGGTTQLQLKHPQL